MKVSFNFIWIGLQNMLTASRLKAMEVLQIITGINPQLCPICRKGIIKPLSCLLPKGNTPL